VSDTTAVTDLLFRPATELAELVRSGEVTSRELVEASFERIAALNDRINAFIHLDEEEALAAADAVDAGDDRPFAGVPTAIKDIGPQWAGRPFTFGSHLFGDYTPDFDAAIVRRFKDAGFIPVGKTNTPEMGILPVTEPRRYGPTRNPWDLDRTPGGSSGGPAAATASGMVPIAHANDGGGSIRIPASCCGLVGLKPARGRVSLAPSLGDNFLVADGVVSRTVRDTAQSLDVLAGYELGDATWAPPSQEPFVNALERDPGKLRVAYTTFPPLETEVDPINVRAVHDAAELLSSLGHEVEEVEPPWRIPELFPVFTKLWCVGIGTGVAWAAGISGQEPTPDAMEPLTWELYKRATELNSIEYAASVVAMQAYGRALVEFLAPYDVLITPTLAQRPVKIGEIDAETGMEAFAKAGQFTPFTAVINVTGQPAISLPLFHGDDGLPTGIHFVGRPAGEFELLSLAAQLETARPWADRRPQLDD
jgi:amidase